MKLFSFFIIISITSCKNNHIVFKYNQFDMENTISSGSMVTINKVVKISRGSMVAFKDRNSNDIKILRIIGIPKDKIEIIKGSYYVNDKLYPNIGTGRRIYTIFIKDDRMFEKLKQYKFSPYSKNYSMFSLSDKEREQIIDMKIVDSIYTLDVDPNQVQSGVLKSESFKYSNIYFFGPLKIPPVNTIIDESVLSIVPQFLSENSIGQKIEDEYFFCIGDNFPEAKDSRFIGLIPRTSIIGVVEKIQNVKSISVDSQIPQAQ